MNNEYLEKLAIKKKLDRYYRGQMRKNGLSDTSLLLKYLPSSLQNRFLRRGIIIAHLEFEKIAEAIVNKKPYVIVSGANPSSALHFGHKAVFDLVTEYAKFGGQVFIPLTNDESYVDGKVESPEKANKIAHEEIMPMLGKMGLGKATIYTDSDNQQIYVLAMKIAGMLDFENVRSAFGDEALKNVGQIFYRGGVQIAQILLPQMPGFGGPKPTLVPVGIDQHPYVLLARDIAKRMGLIPPSELVIKLQPSLKDPEKKMAKSVAGSAIFLNDNPVEVKQKINSAYTGALNRLDEHKKYGAISEIDSAFNMLLFHHLDDEFVNDIYKKYKNGQISAGELKQITTGFVNELLVRYYQGGPPSLKATEG